jgi:hypothetical protein
MLVKSAGRAPVLPGNVDLRKLFGKNNTDFQPVRTGRDGPMSGRAGDDVGRRGLVKVMQLLMYFFVAVAVAWCTTRR